MAHEMVSSSDHMARDMGGRGHVAIACRWLEIRPQDLDGCETLAAFQSLAHSQYRQIIQRYHPDTRSQHPGALKQTPGRVTSYATAFLRVQRAYGRLKRMTPRQWCRLHVGRVQEMELPWDLDRQAYSTQETMPCTWFGYS